jgi:hypothetical protein
MVLLEQIQKRSAFRDATLFLGLRWQMGHASSYEFSQSELANQNVLHHWWAEIEVPRNDFGESKWIIAEGLQLDLPQDSKGSSGPLFVLTGCIPCLEASDPPLDDRKRHSASTKSALQVSVNDLAFVSLYPEKLDH